MRIELTLPNPGTAVTYERYDTANGYEMEVMDLHGKVLGHVYGLPSKSACRSMMGTLMDTFGLRGMTDEEFNKFRMEVYN